MPATVYNLPPIDVGADYSFSLLIDDGFGNPISLSGSTITCVGFLHPDDTSAIFSFTVTPSTTDTGVVILSLAGAQTASLNFDRAFYRVSVTDSSGVVTRYIQGDLTLNA